MAPISRFSATVSVGKHLPALGDLADAEIADAVARPAGDVGAAEADAAARRSQHAGDGADQRGLAGAVGADDGDDRALLDLKRSMPSSAWASP